MNIELESEALKETELRRKTNLKKTQKEATGHNKRLPVIIDIYDGTEQILIVPLGNKKYKVCKIWQHTVVDFNHKPVTQGSATWCILNTALLMLSSCIGRHHN